MPPKGTSKGKTGKKEYVSRQPDKHGRIRYTDEENAIWHDLISRQVPMLPGRACPQWINAMEAMDFPTDRIPQLEEVSGVLRKHTGFSVAPVPALIGFTEFFTLLANRQFPVATFIRSREDFDYIEEPDVFHEVFGHTPPLTDHRFAAFVEAYGRAGLAADPKDHAMLARLFWFTVEFGLVHTAEGIRAYGSGIMSSPGSPLSSITLPAGSDPRDVNIEPGIIEAAAGVTLLGCAGLIAVAMITRKDFSFLRGILVWGGILALVAIASSLLFGWQLGTWFSLGMIGFAGAAVLYDTSNIMHHYPTDKYVAASMALFASIALILASGFWIIYAVYGGFAATGLYVHVMLVFGILMMLIFFHVFFAPFKRLKQSVAKEDWPSGGRYLAQIRMMIGINLLLGLFTIAVASGGRYFT